MKLVNGYAKVMVSLVMLLIGTGVVTKSAFSAEESAVSKAFPDKYMIRAGAYIIDGSRTQFSINSSTAGLGTTIDYKKDLGGSERETIPRIDAYYRFNDRHRIDFTAFTVSRKGRRELTIDLDIEDTDYFINEIVHSEIKYALYKVGYSYSFYHSPEVELSISAGLNITSYDFKFRDDAGQKVEAVGVTVPLPVFGLRMGYSITPKWSLQYVAETFAIDFENTFKGNLFNYELNTEYRLFKNFSIGAGFVRLGLDVEVTDDDWRGAASDSYRGFTAFGTLYF